MGMLEKIVAVVVGANFLGQLAQACRPKQQHEPTRKDFAPGCQPEDRAEFFHESWEEGRAYYIGVSRSPGMPFIGENINPDADPELCLPFRALIKKQVAEGERTLSDWYKRMLPHLEYYDTCRDEDGKPTEEVQGNWGPEICGKWARSEWDEDGNAREAR